MEWIKNHYKTILSSLLTLVLVCSIALLVPGHTASASASRYQTTTNTIEMLESDAASSFVSFGTTPGITLTYNYNIPSGSFGITSEGIHLETGAENGILCYGTANSSDYRYFAYYSPFLDNVTFPSVSGHVDHYELEICFGVDACASAQMAYDNMSNDSRITADTIYKFQPFSLIDRIQFGGVTKSGENVNYDTGNSSGSWLHIDSYYVYDSNGNVFTADDIDYWNTPRPFESYLCKLTVRIYPSEIPSDFLGFRGYMLWFGRDFYYYYYSGIDNYLSIQPFYDSYARTIWMTEKDWEAEQEEQQYRDDVISGIGSIEDSLTTPTTDIPVEDSQLSSDADRFNSAVDEYLSVEDSINQSIQGIYDTYENDSGRYGSLLTGLVSNVKDIANSNVFSACWTFVKGYPLIYWLINMAITLCVMGFLLRR